MIIHRKLAPSLYNNSTTVAEPFLSMLSEILKSPAFNEFLRHLVEIQPSGLGEFGDEREFNMTHLSHTLSHIISFIPATHCYTFSECVAIFPYSS